MRKKIGFFRREFQRCVEKRWEIVDSRTSRSVRLCRDPRNADRAEKKNFIPWMRKAHRNSVYTLSGLTYLSMSTFDQTFSLIHICLEIHFVIVQLRRISINISTHRKRFKFSRNTSVRQSDT